MNSKFRKIISPEFVRQITTEIKHTKKKRVPQANFKPAKVYSQFGK